MHEEQASEEQVAGRAALSSVDVVSELLLPVEHPLWPGQILFDWPWFYDALVRNNVQATRFFGIVSNWVDDPEQHALATPYPYDKKTRLYDISQIREDYEARATERINALCEAGKVVIIACEDHCARTGKPEFRAHPLSAHNNIQHFGPRTIEEATWTGPDASHADLWLKPIYELIDFYLRITKPKNRKYLRFELVNEPVNPDTPWRILLYLQSKGIPRNQIWSSVTPPNRKRCFFEPGAPRHVWDESTRDVFKRGCSVVSFHSCGAIEEAGIYISGKPSSLFASRNKYCEGDYQHYCRERLKGTLEVRPDNDGASTVNGTPVWKVHQNHVMVPVGGVRAVVETKKKYGSYAFLLLENDYALSAADWKKTQKTAEPYFRAVGGGA